VNRSARKLSWLLVSARAARELPLPAAGEGKVAADAGRYFRAREQLLGTAEGLQRLASLPAETRERLRDIRRAGYRSIRRGDSQVAGDFRATRARGRAVDRIERGAGVILERRRLLPSYLFSARLPASSSTGCP
jgi:hypothetical protein